MFPEQYFASAKHLQGDLISFCTQYSDLSLGKGAPIQ